jgi:hypothetical protein
MLVSFPDADETKGILHVRNTKFVGYEKEAVANNLESVTTWNGQLLCGSGCSREPNVSS